MSSQTNNWQCCGYFPPQWEVSSGQLPRHEPIQEPLYNCVGNSTRIESADSARASHSGKLFKRPMLLIHDSPGIIGCAYEFESYRTQTKIYCFPGNNCLIAMDSCPPAAYSRPNQDTLHSHGPVNLLLPSRA